MQRLWRGRARPEVYPSNVIPSRPTCYRCDICDGFQDLSADTNGGDEEGEDEEGSSHGLSQAAAGATTTTATCASKAASLMQPSLQRAEADEEDEEDFSGRPVSTDVTTTILDDTEVAELRYLDPYLVEVLGRPHTGGHSRQLCRHVTAQLARCGLSVRQFVRGVGVGRRRVERYTAAYKEWTQQQQAVKTAAGRARAHRSTSKKSNSATTTNSSSGVVAAAVASPGSAAANDERMAHLEENVALLDLTSYAVRFAIAAYGLPYELGYFNSVAEVMKVQAEPHRRYASATSEEQMASMARMLLGEAPLGMIEFAAARYSLEVGRPCYTLLLDHAARRVVLTFRGTLSLADAVIDVAEGYAQVDLTTCGDSGVIGIEAGSAKAPVPIARLSPRKQQRYGDWGEAHRPSWQSQSDDEEDTQDTTEAYNRSGSRDAAAASAVEGGGLVTRLPLGFYAAAREAATRVLPALDAIYAQYPGYELLITGHSLGGILANVFHLLYCFPLAACKDGSDGSSTSSSSSSSSSSVPFARVQTIGFGTAPIVESHMAGRLNAALEAERVRSGSRLVNFSHGMDCVTRLHVRGLLGSITAAAESAACGTNGSGANGDGLGRAKGRPVTAAASSQGSSINSNGPVGVTDAPATSSSLMSPLPDLAVLPDLTIPGACYNMPHSLRRGYFPVPLDCPWRSQLVLSVEAAYHHFPLLYARAVSRLLVHYTARLAALKADEGEGETGEAMSGNSSSSVAH